MTATPEIIDILRRARDYPYDSPRSSFLFSNGEISDFQVEQIKGRTPVLAFGSNKAPYQLQRKFGHIENSFIPVEIVKLHDFDVVFSAHVTSYGSIPAMLQHCPGVIVEIAITWLDDEQLEIMHRSELYAANYSYSSLVELNIQREFGPQISSAYAYVGERGHFTLGENSDQGIAISIIKATNRKWGEMSTANLLRRLHKDNAPNVSEEEFILRLIADATYRRNLTQRISENEQAFRFPYRIETTADDLTNY